MITPEPLSVSFKMNYKTQKRMKKLYGKKLARDIAFGRLLRKTILKTYVKPNEFLNNNELDEPK
jgi:hypothetical protein